MLLLLQFCGKGVAGLRGKKEFCFGMMENVGRDIICNALFRNDTVWHMKEEARDGYDLFGR